MTFTVSPWWVWAVLSLALFGVVFLWRWTRARARDFRLWWRGWGAGVTKAPWQRAWEWWRRDRVTPLLEDCDHEYTLNEEETYEWCQKCDSIRPLELPPEQSAEELGFTGYLRGYRAEIPLSLLDGEARERRAPWWEAEHRAAYESLGFDYPSGLMARVREAAP